MLRGYSGWNSRRALQVLDQVFPKVLYVCFPSSSPVHTIQVMLFASGLFLTSFLLVGFLGGHGTDVVQIF